VKTLEADRAAAHFSELLDKVHSARLSFQIVKQGVPYGCLVPAASNTCNTHDLADDLDSATLSGADRRGLGTVVRKALRSLKSPQNPLG
jgi:hypothetical protein